MPETSLNLPQVLAGLVAATGMLTAGRALAFSKFAMGNATVTTLSDGSSSVPSAFFKGTTEAQQAALGEISYWRQGPMRSAATTARSCLMQAPAQTTLSRNVSRMSVCCSAIWLRLVLMRRR